MKLAPRAEQHNIDTRVPPAFDPRVQEEDAILERARRGDLSAFNHLVLSHQNLVYNLCLRMLARPTLAEDMTQEAFLAAWRNLDRLRGSFRPWLLRMAANLCTDELRRARRRPAASLEVAFEAGVPEPADPDPAPEDSTLTSELRGQIEGALQSLSAEQRLVVVLCDIEGLAYDEAAMAMGTSIGTVKSRLSRARARLREILLADPELLPDRFRLGR